MDIIKYQQSEEFNRNEAIFVLHTMDKKTLEEIGANFDLAIEKIKEVITIHKQYVAALTEPDI